MSDDKKTNNDGTRPDVAPLIPQTPSDEAYQVDEDQGDVFTSNHPHTLFADWLAMAVKTEPNDPNAMSLATVDAQGHPDVRIVLLKDISPEGLSFFTNYESAKGRALDANPVAALCFHWKTIRRQVRVRGAIERLSAAESDAYFFERAEGAQIGAIVSKQSQVLSDRRQLKEEITAFTSAQQDARLIRPDYWGGYRLKPEAFEFWVNRPWRLHDRKLFVRNGQTQEWTSNWLYP